MELILFTLISLVVVVALLASRLNDNSFPFPFTQKSAIFTPAEKNFQTLLEHAMGSEFKILNRVKLSDLVSVRNGVSQRSSQTAINNANNKYLDFVICHRNNMSLFGTIDLVDTNGKGYKVKKDWFVSGALEAASIPHLRIKVKNSYTVDEIRSCVNSRFLQKSSPTPKVKGRVIPASLVKARPKNKNTGVVSPTAITAKTPQPNLIAQMKSSQAALPH